jgi:hypothetical protein
MKKSEKKYHYTIFHSDAEVDLHLIDSLKKRSDCTCVKMKYRGDWNPLFYILRRIHCSYRLNEIIKLPFRYIWYDFCYRKFDHPENEIVILHTSPFFKYDVLSFFKKWNKRGIKTYVVFVDSVHTNYPSARIIRDVMKVVPKEQIFSFDIDDCKEFGFNYLNECYYDAQLPKQNAKPEYDIYLIARVKAGRVEIINRLYDSFKKHGVKAKMDVAALPKYDKDYYKNPTVRKEIKVIDHLMDYKEAIKRASKANCIMEISQAGQNAPSLRYFEAVTLGKKLLTNVENTKNLNFYNEKYMKITDFEDENIDFDWIKKREKIDYHYKGEFSPANIISMIEKIEKTKQ